MRRALVGAALLAGALLLFAPALGGEFLAWDDTEHLAAVKAYPLARFWTAPYYGLYIPFTYSAWAALWHAFGTPLAFHLFNVVLHALNASFVFLLARRTGVGAWLAACLFLTHPLQVEAVAWISGGRDVLATTFGLAALVFNSSALYVCSLLSKPLLFAWGFVARRPWWLVLAALAGLGVSALQTRWAAGHAGGGSLFVAFDALGVQAWHFVWPFALHADYGRTPAAAQGWAFASLGGVVLLAALRSPRIAAALATLLPTLGLVPFAAQTVSTVFDRYMYTPMVFLALALARCRYAWVLVFVWAAVSFERARVWQDDRTLALDMLEGAPASEPGLVNLAAVELSAGRPLAAVALLRRAPPGSAVVRGNLAHALWDARDLPGVREAVAPLADAEFLARNAHEPAALALMWRMAARVQGAVGDSPRDAYCHALLLTPGDLDLVGEFQAAGVTCVTRESR